MSLPGDDQDGNGFELEKLRLNFSRSFRASSNKSILMAVVCFLSVNYVYIFLLIFKDNVVDDLTLSRPGGGGGGGAFGARANFEDL